MAYNKEKKRFKAIQTLSRPSKFSSLDNSEKKNVFDLAVEG